MLLHPASERENWWRDAVIYQIYPRSFASSGGPLGDLRGIESRLGYLADLGIDAVWLSPFYRSPQFDAGYDVSDYRDVDPRFGTLKDAEHLIEAAHEAGLRIIVDIVPNHTSWDHELFRRAVAAGPGSPERELFWFREGKNGGSEPPTNWRSVFGGPAWSRVRDLPFVAGTPAAEEDLYYLHLFDRSQPDLNWQNPAVRAEFLATLRFGLDRGADGFRVDVAHGLMKDPALPDWSGAVEMAGVTEKPEPAPFFDRDEVHEIYREWRAVLDEYSPERILVAEAWADTEERLARYIRPDEMNQAFNFIYLAAPFEREALREIIVQSLRQSDRVGAPTTWVLSNHDGVRVCSRLGYRDTSRGANGIGANDPQPDRELGARRALAWHQLTAGLPGVYYIYQGEERNLPEHTSLPDEVREDPTFARTHGKELGRDGCRVPLPWESDRPGCGFSPDGATWLPQGADWARYTVDVQEADPHSPLHFFRTMLRLRDELELGVGSLEDVCDEYGAGVLAYVNRAANTNRAAHAQRPPVLMLTVFDDAAPLPSGWRVLLASDPAASALGEGEMIPADTTVWLVPVE